MIDQILVELRELNQLKKFDKPIFSFEEFCQFADLSKDYVRKLQNDGLIPFYRPFGRKLYITREDAIACLMQNPVGSNATREKLANHHLLTSKTSAI